MKRILLLLWLCLVAGELLAAGDSLFTEANLHYQEGNYEQALQAYQQINQEGLESADLYYNMGNAAFRSNSIGYAILYYEKALKMDPGHDDARHNLEFVSRYRVDTFDEVPELFIRSWIRALVNTLSERNWSILSLLLFILFLAGLVVYLFSRRLALKKTGFFTAMLALLLFGVSFSSALYRHHSIVRPQEGIVTAPTVVVRSSPSEAGTELFVLHEGTKVTVNEAVSGWQNIRVVDGREGWIAGTDFESI